MLKFNTSFNSSICRSATPQTRSPGGSSTGAERDSSGVITKDRTVSYVKSFLLVVSMELKVLRKKWQECYHNLTFSRRL